MSLAVFANVTELEADAGRLARLVESRAQRECRQWPAVVVLYEIEATPIAWPRCDSLDDFGQFAHKVDGSFHARLVLRDEEGGHCMDNDIEISPQERYFATDTEYEINDRGEVVEGVAKLSLARNIRFALALRRRALGIAEPFDASVEWWCSLREAIRIRDRLTHPKLPGDLDLTGDDIVKVLKAKSGFEHELMSRQSDSPEAKRGSTKL